MQKVGAFSEQNWKSIIHFQFSHLINKKPSINNQSTNQSINQQSISNQSTTLDASQFSLPKVASSKTVLKLDFRREALRDAAQMTFRKWPPNEL